MKKRKIAVSLTERQYDALTQAYMWLASRTETMDAIIKGTADIATMFDLINKEVRP